jgi:hypothetical protein
MSPVLLYLTHSIFQNPHGAKHSETDGNLKFVQYHFTKFGMLIPAAAIGSKGYKRTTILNVRQF